MDCREFTTGFGTVKVMGKSATMRILSELVGKESVLEDERSIALTGGSTPKAFYSWLNERKQDKQPLSLKNLVWTVSDERCVPLTDIESNFGNADRGFLRSFRISENQKIYWRTELEPNLAATRFEAIWAERFGTDRCFDLCFLGMGEDCHTASIFPGSILLEKVSRTRFSAVEAPDKGWRLTVTPEGLIKCRQIVVTVSGAGKAAALREVLEGEYNPLAKPVQILSRCPEKVTWLVDFEAAANLAVA